MKNTKLFYSSPFMILGLFLGLSGPISANPGMTDTTAEAPVGIPLPEPSLPTVDELSPDAETQPTEMSEMDDADTTSETPAEETPSAEAPETEMSETEMSETEMSETEMSETEMSETEMSETEMPEASSTPEEMPAMEEMPETDESSSSDASSNTVVDVAGSNEAFSTLVTAIDAAGLKETLMADGTFTVFAPTNEAFEGLPEGVLETLLKPENQALLAKVLTHHVLGEKKMAADLSTGEVMALSESALQIKVDETGVGIDDAQVLQADVPASNGVIHVIDQVLIPQELLQ